MDISKQLANYSGRNNFLLILKKKIENKESLSTGQTIIAKQLLTSEAIDNNDKGFFIPEIKQINVEWKKYETETRKPFSFQKEGINWLLNKEYAILGDEMGTGKTSQAIIAALEASSKKILIICPNILKLNWKKEISFYDDPNNIHVCYSKDFDMSKKWTIINYDIVAKFKEQLKKGKFDLLVTDEAQNCKNLQTKRGSAVKSISLKCKKVWLLTGTPIANRPIDFYALLKICKHSLGSDKAFFAKTFCGGQINPFTMGYQTDGASNLKELHYKTQDIMLRRLKKDCLDLPDKILTPVLLKLSNKKAYDSAPKDKIQEMYLQSLDPNSDRFNKEIEEGAKFVELAAWRRYCAFEKIKDGSTLDLINECLERDEKVIVFSSYIDTMVALKEKLGDHAALIQGSVSPEQRELIIHNFQTSPEVKVIIVQIMIGNAGLTLTAANNVIYIFC